MKKEVFAELERVVSPECVIATNTSSLSVTEMGSSLEHPERVVGMHFFNPVAVLPLVELVRTPATDDVSIATAWAVTKKLRKTGVLVQDAHRIRRQPAPRPPGLDHHAGARPREHGRRDRRGRAPDGAPDGALGAPPARRPEGREPRAAPAARRRGRTATRSRSRSRASPRAATSVVVENAPRIGRRAPPRRCSRRSPTSRATSSRTASSPRRPTSTPACSSVPASRSGSAGSRSTSIRRASPSGSSGVRWPSSAHALLTRSVRR